MTMVNELSENEILDYLMTSEFGEGLNPDEFKFLLFKFRNFYRVASCSISTSKERMEKAINDSIEVKSSSELKILEIENQKIEIENKLNTLLDRKLTWKERFNGKIIKENEN